MTQPLFPDHHSSDVQSHDRPSLFDLLAQEQLRELFHPVIRYVLSYFAQRYPRYLLRLLNHHEEFFAALLLLSERYHLKRHNATISEHFYGLRLSNASQNIPTPRLSALQNHGMQRQRQMLTRKQRWGILIFIVGIPYLRARAQDYYERLGGGEEGDIDPGRTVTTKQRIFKTIYPYANLALDGSFLIYDLAYLFEKTNHYRPWHKLLNLKIIRRGPDAPENEDTSFFAKLPPLLPPLLLLLKLSQWWYSPSSPRTFSSLTSDRNTLASIHAAILPPRPLPILPQSGLLPPDDGDGDGDGPQQTEEYTIGPREYGKCPLCKKNWQNPAILPSGWVVCWRCGWDAVEGDDEDEDEDEDEYDTELKEDREVVGNGVKEVSDNGRTSLSPSRRKGRCPITGVVVAPGELRRVLV